MRARRFAMLLRGLAAVCLAVGATHLLLGPRADVLLGAHIRPEVLADPVVDSQNRFYGVAFAIYGVLLWMAAADLPRHAAVLRALLAVFFAAGIARLVSVAVTGVPAAPVLVLTALELALPPLLWRWSGAAVRET